MIKALLFVPMCLLVNPAVAQSASDDPCALTLFHFDRTMQDADLDEMAYRRDVTSMLSVAAASLKMEPAETLLAVRYACARLPTLTFLQAIAEVIDEGFKARSGMSSFVEGGRAADPLVLGNPLIIDETIKRP